jgi:type IV pilus assembly protein PilW
MKTILASVGMRQPRVREPRVRQRQGGFTLVELSVAVVIGLFLLGALATIVQDNRRTFTSQNQQAQLQDSERLAMSMMTDVIQASGYFPNPLLYSASGANTFPVSGAMLQGQAMTGLYSAAAPGDSITARYATASGDGIINCTGNSNTSGGVGNYINTFNVNAANQLVCTMNGVAYPLVNGVNKLSILYGVSTQGTTNVDTYMNATQVSAALLWNSVVSASISLTFNNPLYVAGKTDQPQFFTIQRVVGIMNKAGVQ